MLSGRKGRTRLGISVARILAAMASLLMTEAATAHGGGLDSSGCHHDRKRGGYHCHRGSTPTPTPRPRSGGLWNGLSAAQLRDHASTESAQRVAGSVQASALTAPTSLPAPVVGTTTNLPILGPATVTDGDGLVVGGIHLRLYGIDAFEADQRCGPQFEAACGANATEALRKLVSNTWLTCVERGVDRYRRTLAVCRVGLTDINAAMVRTGWAMAYRQFSNDYTNDEDIAHQGRAGAWSSTFRWPWDHRAGGGGQIAIAQRFDEGPTDKCDIKGNVTSKGERIYHLPTAPTYQQTKAEALFCSEAAAINAGFRKPR